ncbi:MAG: hypothetical protein HC794_06445, partial [Nitrospiraceae bacterium]|nr:hypothetical protein [Nitrospiraceae bacterium]
GRHRIAGRNTQASASSKTDSTETVVSVERIPDVGGTDAGSEDGEVGEA